ncbi:MAG: hypothetical protein ACJ75D_06905 [Gaiellaceae bacterium]
MKKSFRLALLVGASFVGLAFAGPALAAYNPSLTIEQTSYKLGAPFTLDLFLAASESDDPSAKLTIFSPAGYGVNLSKPPGTKIGSALALAKIGALGGANYPLTGDVVVGNPADPALMVTSTKCTGSPTNQSVLVLNLSLQGQAPTPFPVFVNKVGPLTTFQICAPHPDISPTNPSGVRILLLDATIKGVFTNPSASNGYEWSTIFTPYGPTKAPNPAASIEWRTYVGLPSSLTLKKAKAKRGFKLVGQLKVAGLLPTGVKLNLYAGKKARPAPTAVSSGTGKRIARSPKLPRTGKYSIARRNVKFATFFQTRFENYGTQCTGPSPSGLPFPCSGEDIAAVTSNQLKVLKPKKKKRH